MMLVYLSLAATPFIIFCAKPMHSLKWRIQRTLIAFAVIYFSIMYRFYAAAIEKVELRQIGYADTAPMNVFDFVLSNGALGHWVFLGWIWTFTYIGWWEFAWRIYHRRSLIGLRKGIGDDCLNNAIVTLSYYIGMLLLIIGLIAVADYFWPGFYKLSSMAIDHSPSMT